MAGADDAGGFSGEELTAQDGFSARLSAISSGRRVEDLSLRTEYEQVFANPDGTWTSEASTMAQFVERDGVLEPIGDSGLLTDAGTPVVGDGTQLSVADGTEVVGDGPTGTSVVLAELTGKDGDKDVSLELGWEGRLAAPVIKDSQAVYSEGVEVPVEGASPSARGAQSGPAHQDTTGGAEGSVLDARVEVEPLRSGFSHRTILDTVPDGDVVLRFPITLSKGLTLTREEETGDLRAVNGQGETVFFAPAPTMWDAKVDPASGLFAAETLVDTEIVVEDGVPVLVLRAGADWLQDPARQYPVTIDPSWIKGVSDTWAESDVTGSKAGDVELRVGTFNGGAVKARSFLQYTSTKLDGKKIVKAELRMRNYYSYSCTSSPVKVQRLTSAWTSTEVRWNKQPTATATGEGNNNVSKGYSSSCAEGYVYYPVTPIVQYWADNPTKNFGVRLIGADETNSYTWKRYHSANYVAGSADYRPKFVVTYNSYPSKPSAVTFNSGESFKDSAGKTWVKTKTPTLRATVADVDGDKVKAEFDVTGTPELLKKAGSTVASGSVSTYKTSTLTENGTYTVKAWANDGTLRSKSAGSSTTFTVDSIKPVKPSITSSAYAPGEWKDARPSSNVFTMTSGSSDVVKFQYRKDTLAWTDATMNGTTGTLEWNPAGGRTLTVVAVDRAGNRSEEETFSFGAGSASINTPTSSGVKTTATYDVRATAPGQGLESYDLMWRIKGNPNDPDFDPVVGTSEKWTLLKKEPLISNEISLTVTQPFDTAAALAKLAEDTTVDRTRKHTVFEVQMCFNYTNPAKTRCTWTADPATHSTITYVPHAFGSNFPVADAGPGQVALWTGEFNTSVTDVSVPGYLGDLSISRSFSTFNNQHDGAFGKGWKPSFDGTDAGVAGYEVVDDTAFDGTIALVDEEENAAIFSQGTSKIAQKEGSYTPVDDETAQLGLRLELKGTGTSATLVLTEDDGTVTTWKHQGAGVWAPLSVRVAGDPSATTFTYDAGKNLTRIVAPHPEEISCSPGAEQPGCRVLTLKYPSAAVNARLQWVSYTAFDPDEGSTGAMVPKKVVEYTYDTAGNLTKVTDPRTGLSTSYTYAKGAIDNVIRLTGITPSGLDGYTLDYRGGAATAPFTDGVTSVKRGSTYMNAYAYNLDVTNANLPVMTANQVAKWGQQVAPTNVFATFGQDSASQAVTALSADVLKKADLSYTDNDGRVINTASYTGAEGGHWNLTATDFDGSGNVIRLLDEPGIAQVLDAVAGGIEVSADEYATIIRYNADILAPSTVNVAGKAITAGDVVTAAGTLVTDVWEPVREIVAHDGTVSLGRQHTRTTYDQGAPNGGYNPETGLPFRLATTTTVTLAEPDTATSDPSIPPVAGEPVLSEQRLGYDPIDGASIVGKTSGWIVGAPTVSTTENGSADITTKTVYDVQGRAVKEIGADSNGSDAGTTVTHYYDAGEPTGTPAACRNTAKWAGMACQTTTGEATPTVPVTTTTKYSYYLAPQITLEELGGVKRTTTTTFDSAGRVDTSVTSVTGMTGSTAQPKTKNFYSTATGLQLETQTVDANNVILKRVKTGYDTWGRAISYTDQDGRTSSTSYDAAGRVSTETSAKDNVVTTYTYEPYSGAVTKKNITGVGDFVAQYDRFGNITAQALPTGVTHTSSYDRTGQETSLSYTITGAEGEAGYGWTMDHDALGRIHQVTGPSSEGGTRVSSYGFDMAARMITASDQIDDQCVTRTYGFDTVGRRTSVKTATSTCGGTATTTTKTWTYDKADRILKGANSTGDYVYDKLGRQTSLPAIDTHAGVQAGNLTVSYYDSDLARTVTQNGVATTYNLDVMDRHSTSTTTSSGGTSTTTRYYEDTSDNPAWATTVAGGKTETSRYLSSIAGDLSVTQNVSTKTLSTGIIDPQGSVVATSYTHTPEVENGQAAAPVTMWSGLESFDEYGNKLAVSQDKSTGALDFSWQGGKERATDLSGLVLMGVRLYNSVTGQFTSVDPVKGGNTTAYAYPQDPINLCDLTGLSRAECNVIKAGIERKMGEIDSRGRDLVEDKLGLPLYGSFSVYSHIQEFKATQRALRNYYNRFEKLNCWKYGMKTPKNVWHQMTRQPKLNSKIKWLRGKLVRTSSKEWKAYMRSLRGVGGKGIGGVGGGSGNNFKR